MQAKFLKNIDYFQKRLKFNFKLHRFAFSYRKIYKKIK